jgi:hypothetical protein
MLRRTGVSRVDAELSKIILYYLLGAGQFEARSRWRIGFSPARNAFGMGTQ